MLAGGRRESPERNVTQCCSHAMQPWKVDWPPEEQHWEPGSGVDSQEGAGGLDEFVGLVDSDHVACVRDVHGCLPRCFIWSMVWSDTRPLSAPLTSKIGQVMESIPFQ